MLEDAAVEVRVAHVAVEEDNGREAPPLLLGDAEDGGPRRGPSDVGGEGGRGGGGVPPAAAGGAGEERSEGPAEGEQGRRHGGRGDEEARGNTTRAKVSCGRRSLSFDLRKTVRCKGRSTHRCIESKKAVRGREGGGGGLFVPSAPAAPLASAAPRGTDIWLVVNGKGPCRRRRVGG